jgi:2-polyprenyl-6-methoxyphenol hydroxylase-like FAD-dependent oxidoreductase
MNTIGEHAVVLGGSISGLLAARVLADRYERVTIVERDPLPESREPRKGVPQGRQAHILLQPGGHIMNELFPGLLDELAAAGVPVLRDFSELYFSVGGQVLNPAGPGEPTYQPSRPFLEGRLRSRVRVLPNVVFRDACDVVGLTASPGKDRVTGVGLLPPSM